MNNFIDFLPREILEYIFSYLDEKELAFRHVLVCKKWKNIILDENFCLNKYVALFLKEAKLKKKIAHLKNEFSKEKNILKKNILEDAIDDAKSSMNDVKSSIYTTKMNYKSKKYQKYMPFLKKCFDLHSFNCEILDDITHFGVGYSKKKREKYLVVLFNKDGVHLNFGQKDSQSSSFDMAIEDPIFCDSDDCPICSKIKCLIAEKNEPIKMVGFVFNDDYNTLTMISGNDTIVDITIKNYLSIIKNRDFQYFSELGTKNLKLYPYNYLPKPKSKHLQNVHYMIFQLIRISECLENNLYTF